MYNILKDETNIYLSDSPEPQQIVSFGANIRLNPVEIVFLTADANYTNIYLHNGKKYFLACTLGKVHQKLKDLEFFVRPNRNTVVNLNFLIDYNYDAITVHNQTFTISKRRKLCINNILLNKQNN